MHFKRNRRETLHFYKIVPLEIINLGDLEGLWVQNSVLSDSIYCGFQLLLQQYIKA